MRSGWNRHSILSNAGLWDLLVLLPYASPGIAPGLLNIIELYHACNNILLKAFIRNEPQGVVMQRVLHWINNKIMEQQKKKSCNNFCESHSGNWIKLFHHEIGNSYSFPLYIKSESLQFASKRTFLSFSLCSNGCSFTDNETNLLPLLSGLKLVSQYSG